MSYVNLVVKRHYHQALRCIIKKKLSCLSVTTTGPVVKSIVCLTADPEVASLIPTQYHTFMELDHKVISMGILLLHLIHEGYVVVSYKCVQEVLVICFKSSLPRKKL